MNFEKPNKLGKIFAISLVRWPQCVISAVFVTLLAMILFILTVLVGQVLRLMHFGIQLTRTKNTAHIHR